MKKTHGLSNTPTFNSWLAMRQRCYYSKHVSWKNYGGRGIKVCARWRNSFENFFADMGIRPEGMSLDRKNNNGNYTPKNCRWITLRDQSKNTRQNRVITYKGVTLNLVAWSKRIGINYKSLSGRLEKHPLVVALNPGKMRSGCSGTGNGNAKLNESKIRSIRRRYKPHVVTLNMLAKEYGVAIQSIFAAIRRRTWRHV